MTTTPALYPVVLCGGSGTRLWPLSRANYPKQLITLVDEKHSLLQSTLLRAAVHRRGTVFQMSSERR